MCIEKDCCLRRLQLSRSRESEITLTIIFKGLLSWYSGEESASQCRRPKRLGFDSWVRKISWRRKWQPPQVFLLGKSHGQRSLGGCNPWGHKESDILEWLSTHTSYLSAYFNLGSLLSVYLTFFSLNSIKKGIIIQVLHIRTLKIRKVKRCVQVQLS